MADYCNSHKNKWQSQRIAKVYKNRHRKHTQQWDGPRANVTLFYKQNQIKSANSMANNDEWNHPHSISRALSRSYSTESHFSSEWICVRCTYKNSENNSYCSICEFSFESTCTSNAKRDSFSDQYICDLIEPIPMTNDDSTDIDAELQFAIVSSLQTVYDTNKKKANKPSLGSTQPTNKINATKKRRVQSFASYWSEATKSHQILQKLLRYRSKVRYSKWLEMKEEEEREKKATEKEFGIPKDGEIHKLIQESPEFANALPTKSEVQSWLSSEYHASQLNGRIRSVLNRETLRRFLNKGHYNTRGYTVAYHGTYACNVDSICRSGLVVGGTKGVPVRHGAAYGRGVYCSPYTSSAAAYERGAIFVCLVRKCSYYLANNGRFYVVPNDGDILPVYVANISGACHSNYFAHGMVFMFRTNFKPFNQRQTEKRKVRRKWSAFYKLQ